jgi:ribosomal protein S4
LVGVGFPLGVLRKLVDKAIASGRGGGKVQADDYEIHVGAVSECGSRNRLSEALQKELERRYATVLLRFRAARSTAQVEQLWCAAVAGGDVAGAFWAGLTHPRCSPELEEQMCRDLHMVQHQAGACARADLGKFNATLAENAQLVHDLDKVRQRINAVLAEKSADTERHATQLMQQRAQVVGKDSMIESLRAELEQLKSSIPGLETRNRLAARLEQMEERERALRNQITDLRLEVSAAKAVAPAPAPVAAREVVEHVMKMAPRLNQQAVLCVGGRSGNVATYRELIEREGAQFAHHDGGLEDNANRLDASLAAADLVICQTGCISHSAYWRVKDYCKRTGKRCVFIDNPSASSLARGLKEVAEY